jgi:hypothetical protein
MKSIFTLFVPLCLCGSILAAPPREPVDEAIDRGLQFLRQTQNTDGGWSSGGQSYFRDEWDGSLRGATSDPAVSALAVMAFLSAGHVPGEGPHGAAVARGIRYVMNSQQRNGVFALPGAGNTEMYYHGICTLMLGEATGMTDVRTADELRQRLEAAVKVILQAQRKSATLEANGGWRYRVTGWDADLSVTGWQLMALRSARNVGCDVPKDRIQAAVAYIRRCHDPVSGGYRYTTTAPVTIPCTGTGVLALELCGKEYHRSPEALKAGEYLLKYNLDPNRMHFFYGIYYTAQAMFQLGDNYWKSYRPRLHELLLRSIPPRATGEWVGRSGDDSRFGPCYCTAMAILALTVEYRYLPIYQRFEEPIKRDEPN